MITQNLKTSFKTLKVCLLIIAMVFVVGCSKDDDCLPCLPCNEDANTLIGVWECVWYIDSLLYVETYIFNSNETYSNIFSQVDDTDTHRGTYIVEENKIIFHRTYKNGYAVNYYDTLFFKKEIDSYGEYLLIVPYEDVFDIFDMERYYKMK